MTSPARLALLLPLVFALACGSSGETVTPQSAETPSQEFDFGLVPATRPTTKAVTVTNPLSTDATVEVSQASGPFQLDLGAAPATVPGGGERQFSATFTPLSSGAATGRTQLQLSGSGGATPLDVDFRANAEVPSWEYDPPALSFGVVAPGGSATLDVQIRNTSTLTTVQLLGGASADGAFVADPADFPVAVGPGQPVTVSVRYEPPGEGGHASEFELTSDVPGGAPKIPASGSAPGPGETVHDFGIVTLEGDMTPSFDVDVPSDAISLTVEGWMASAGTGTVTSQSKQPISGGSSTPIGLGELTGPGGHVYENASSTGPLLWIDEPEVFAISIPSSDRSQLQLVPGGGTYSFRLKRMQGTGGQMHVRAIVESRTPPDSGILHLNVWLANSLSVDAASAPGDSRLQEILQWIEDIWSQQNITLGNILYFDVTDSTYDRVTEGEFGGLLRLTKAAPDAHANLFFVEEAIGGGVVGVAGAIGAGRRNGTSGSGVMSVYDSGFSTAIIGLIAAHELGHFLGLFHTVEQSGSHDLIDDTANCPPKGTSAACPVQGGGLLMHWQAVGGSDITDGQGLVLRGHPLVAPVGPGSTFRYLRRVVLSPHHLEELRTLPSNWCGTCAEHHKLNPPSTDDE